MSSKRQRAGRPLVDPIVQTSVYAFDSAESAAYAFTSGDPLYSRDRLPNVRTLECAIADLEEAEAALATSSGMAAISVVAFALLASGDHVLVDTKLYCDTSALFDDLSDKFCVGVTQVDMCNLDAVRTAITPSTRLVIAESIANPSLHLVDISRLAFLAHTVDALLMIDNTLATPSLCQPLTLGADLVVHSVGKFLAGHSDVTAGVIAANDKIIDSLRRTAYLLGPVLAPMEAWLAYRGLQTFRQRFSWSSTSAREIAGWLRDQPGVSQVRLAGEGGYTNNTGFLLTFSLSGGESAADHLLRELKLIPYAPTVGGATTTVSYPARTPHFDLPGEFAIYRSEWIRLSVGLEETTEIISDLAQALHSFSRPTQEAGMG